ncbi:MAG: fimbrillin family protein, partial [Bacteroides sp.]|nr:fimbrillin family protein [Bacteroides sp.]
YNYILAFISAGALIASCSQEEEVVNPGDQIQCLQLSISNPGFQDIESRATNAAYVTKFADGDAVGVYAVKSDGSIVEDINNRKFIYSEGVWDVEGDVIEYKGTEFRRFTFYAYYPYSENPAFEPTATDPFATMVNRWVIGAEQSGDNYTKYDLMTSTGSAEGERLQGKVSFVMSHCMGLVVIKMPSLTYSFDGTSIEDYVIPGIAPETISIDGNEGSAFYDDETQTYMMLVKPDTKATIAGTYTGVKKMSFSFEATLESGSAKQYTIKDESKISHTLAVGDYFCADGKLVSGSSETIPENSIGIVCYVGNPQPHVTHPESNTTESDALYRDYPEAKHGLVLALNDPENSRDENINADKTLTKFSDGAGLFSTWFTADEEWSTKFIGCNTGNSTYPSDMFPGYLGYNNTTLLTMCYERGSTTASDPAYTCITTYRDSVPVPATASAWYVPSLAELDIVSANMSTLNRRIDSVGGTALVSTDAGVLVGFYWSSNERNDSYMWVHHMNGGSEFLNRERYSRSGYLRMMLAF